MLHIACFIIVKGHNIKKMFCKNLLPLASPPRRESTPSNAHTKQGEKDINTAQNMLCIICMVILSHHGIKKISFENFDF